MAANGGLRPPFTSLAIAVALTASATPVLAFTETSARAEAYTFAFQNAEITQVVQEVLGEAGIPFTIDPSVSGKVSFRIEQRLTRDQLVAALEAVLAANNVAMVRNGEMLHVAPQSKAKATAEIRQGAQALRGAGYEIVAVPLAFAQPTEVARAMEAISEANSVLYANDKLGLLLLGGAGPQLRAALDTLKVFDQSSFQDSKIRWHELSQAQAQTVAAELERIVQGAGLVGVSVVPLKRLNGVIVFGRSTEALDELGKWVGRLDTPGKEVSSTLWVYRPQYGSAEALSRTLGGLFGGAMSQSAPSSAAPVASASVATDAPAPMTSMMANSDDEVRIGVDKDTNALLIFASPTKWVQIQRVLGEIDRSQRQILIEASIIEVTLGDQFQFGLDWKVFARDLQISSVNNNTGAVRPSFPGLSITLINGDIEAAVKALGARTEIEVVSAPKIIALDNRTARLQVGDQVPIVTQSSQSTTTPEASLISTVDYRSTGIILSVTPRITGQDRLVLEVSQEVSSVAKTSTSGIDSPTIQQRRFESALILQDGATVALGGLISTNRSRSNSGVPWVKDVPGVGALFKTQGRDNNRSELIVLLSAKILPDPETASKAMADLATDMRELQSRGLLPFAQP